jgi:hypothetical protein
MAPLTLTEDGPARFAHEAGAFRICQNSLAGMRIDAVLYPAAKVLTKQGAHRDAWIAAVVDALERRQGSSRDGC